MPFSLTASCVWTCCLKNTLLPPPRPRLPLSVCSSPTHHPRLGLPTRCFVSHPWACLHREHNDFIVRVAVGPSVAFPTWVDLDFWGQDQILFIFSTQYLVLVISSVNIDQNDEWMSDTDHHERNCTSRVHDSSLLCYETCERNDTQHSVCDINTCALCAYFNGEAYKVLLIIESFTLRTCDHMTVYKMCHLWRSTVHKSLPR